MLFHARFALGFLLLANGDKKYSKVILHERVSTELSVRGAEVRSGPRIVSYTGDMATGKWQTALYLLPEYLRQEDYGEMLYLMTEAAACNSWDTVMVSLAPAVLDRWATKCENEDASQGFDFPTLEWLDLFAEAVEILSVCQEIDSSATLPNECKKESAQYLAWKFGKIAGTFIVPDNRWHDDPFSNLWELSHAVEDGSLQFQRGQEKTYRALKAAVSLLCEYDPARDWQKIQKQYVSMWKSSYSYRGMPLADIGPDTDLYWAMKIGFVDKMLETAEQRALIQTQFEPVHIIRDIESIKNIVSTVALRQLKQQQNLEGVLQRLPPSTRDIHQHLQQQLGVVWRELPTKVVNTSVKAEKYYRSEVNDDDAKVWFHKAVEASLDCCVVKPLVNFMQKRGDKQIAICFPLPRGVERKSSTELRKLSLWEWSDVLETVATACHKGLASLGTEDLKEFMQAHLGGPRLPDLRSLARSLRMVQQYRKGSAHYQEAVSRYDKEKWELEQMRNLVLGIDRPSIITQIFRLLGAKKQL